MLHYTTTEPTWLCIFLFSTCALWEMAEALVTLQKCKKLGTFVFFSVTGSHGTKGANAQNIHQQLYPFQQKRGFPAGETRLRLVLAKTSGAAYNMKLTLL